MSKASLHFLQFCLAALLLRRLVLAWHANQPFSFRSRTLLGRCTVLTPLWAQPPRQPRRTLQKRRRRREKQDLIEDDDSDLWETAEIRPLVSSRSKELGEDYWIDEIDLKREKERLASRPPDPGQIPKRKLWNEVLSPYKQNWIGLVSVGVVILATIITKFPELLSTPTITIPDL